MNVAFYRIEGSLLSPQSSDQLSAPPRDRGRVPAPTARHGRAAHRGSDSPLRGNLTTIRARAPQARQSGNWRERRACRDLRDCRARGPRPDTGSMCRRSQQRGVVQVPHRSRQQPGASGEDRSSVLTLICRQLCHRYPPRERAVRHAKPQLNRADIPVPVAVPGGARR
jgi:hypothetical protein